MRTLSVVGARPQFVKLAPVSRAMKRVAAETGARIEDVIVHTGQHYDPAMSAVFFDELELPTPKVDLGVGSASHAVQTARMLEALEGCIGDLRPDVVIIYGDTNSTVAAALAAAKLHVPIAHIEAGLRSFNRMMPEEINRVVADHVSTVLYAPTETAMRNLADENLSARALLSGDVMLDAVVFNRELAWKKSTILERMKVEPGHYIVATVHRPVNSDGRALGDILETMNLLGRPSRPVLFVAHPRTIARMKSSFGRWKPSANLHVVEPLGALDMLRLTESAELVLTDSGGLQKESLFLGVPCVTLREETEWPETLVSGGALLAGNDPRRILEAVDSLQSSVRGDTDLAARAGDLFGGARAAERIVDDLLGRFSNAGLSTKRVTA